MRTFFGLASICTCYWFGVVRGVALEKEQLTTPYGVGSVTLWSLSCVLYPSGAGVKRDSVVPAVGFLP